MTWLRIAGILFIAGVCGWLAGWVIIGCYGTIPRDPFMVRVHLVLWESALATCAALLLTQRDEREQRISTFISGL